MESRVVGTTRDHAAPTHQPRLARGDVRLILALLAAGWLAAPAFMAAAQDKEGPPLKQAFVEEPSRLGPPGAASCSGKGIVKQVYLGLSGALKDFTDEERCRAARVAVRENGGRSAADIIAYARTGIGGLEISSNPAGATIWVNGVRLEGPTLTRAITTVGPKTVKLALAGHAEETGTITVEPARWVRFQRDLKKP